MFCGVRRDQVCQVRNQSSPSSLLSLPTPLPHCVWLYVLIKSIYTIILYYCQPKQLLLLWPEILYVRNSPLEFLPSPLEHCLESSSNTRLVFVQIIWLDSIYFNQLRGSRISRCMVTSPLKGRSKPTPWSSSSSTPWSTKSVDAVFQWSTPPTFSSQITTS